MRCAGKIYGASSAAAPRGIYVEIISVNILYLINMVHSSTVRAAAGRGRGEVWTVVLTKAARKKLPCDSRFFIVYYTVSSTGSSTDSGHIMR